MRLSSAAVVVSLAAAVSSVASAADALIVLHPQPYAKLADSQLFGGMSLDDEFQLENFEDGAVNALGLTISGGAVVAPSATTDSVDADDGAINGSGTAGRSYRANAGANISITLSAAALGGFPERLSFAWTDGPAASSLSVAVTTADGQTFSQVVGPLGDAADNGAAAEDRLVSIVSSLGIAQVTLSMAGAAFEIDHVQYEDPVASQSASWNSHDFDDDGHHDILWINSSNHSAASWLMDGLGFDNGGLNLPVPATWTFVGAGATDQSQKTFLFFRDSATGLFFVWKLSGHEVEPEGQIEDVGPVSSDWQVLAIKDFDGDVDADVAFKNANTGAVMVWVMDNHSVVAAVSLGSAAGLAFLGAGDFNGDRRFDLMWRDGAGVVRGWLMKGDGSGVSVDVWDDSAIANVGAVAPAWQVSAIGDLDGDRCDDIVWRNAGSGSVNVWRLAGLAKASGGTIALNVSPTWQIDGLVDIDGDHKCDLLWRHSSSHKLNGWMMDGTSKIDGGFIHQSGAGWEICKY